MQDGLQCQSTQGGLHILMDPPLLTHYGGLLGDLQEGLGFPVHPDPLEDQPRSPGYRAEMEALGVDGQAWAWAGALAKVLKKHKRLMPNQAGLEVA